MKSLILRVTDKKIGHDRQSIGLCNALRRIDGRNIEEINALSFLGAIRYLFSSVKPIDASLIVGAGHRTHWTLIAYRWKHKVHSIVIMKPSLPRKLFSICVIPKHDRLPECGNIILTEGAMNDIVPSECLVKKHQILILIGGESKHAVWDDQSVYEQISRAITKLDRESPYGFSVILTTSRRTPRSFLANFPVLLEDKIQIVPFEETNAYWMRDYLSASPYVWVTSDSISMIYEALTANAKPYLITLPKIKGRLQENITHLVAKGWVKGVHDFCLTLTINPLSHKMLDEAQRIAHLIKAKGM